MTRVDHVATRRRPGLTRQRVVDAAIALVDQDGADALSMRRLASSLGVEAMSLYNHVAGRDDLLDAVAEAVLGGLAMPVDPAMPWDDRVRATGAAFRQAAADHPGSFRLVLTRQLGSGDGLRPTILGLHVLADAGLTPEQSVHFVRAFLAFTVGSLMRELDAAPGFSAATSDEALAREEVLRSAGSPLLADAAPFLAVCDHAAEFSFGIELLIAAIGAAGRGAGG